MDGSLRPPVVALHAELPMRHADEIVVGTLAGHGEDWVLSAAEMACDQVATVVGVDDSQVGFASRR